MSEKRRTPYQQEMDALHVPEEKANETLKMMLAENRRLREESAKKNRGFVKSPRFWGAFAAVAACAVLMLAVLPGRTGEKYTFTAVDYLSLPSADLSRGETESGLTMEGTLGVSAETLFPGWETSWENTIQLPSDGEKLYLTQLALRKGDQQLNAEVTNTVPAIAEVVSEEYEMNGKKIRLARDEAMKTVYAVYQRDNLYIVLSAGGGEENMIQTLKELTR